MKDHFKASGKYELDLWLDRESIDLGTNWHEAIQAGLRQSDYGLLMVSPKFCGSEYIGKEELPYLLEKDAVLPVALRPWAKDADLKGLAAHQIFFHEHKAFTKAAAKKEDFAKDRAAVLRSLRQAKELDAVGRYVTSLRSKIKEQITFDTRLLEESANDDSGDG